MSTSIGTCGSVWPVAPVGVDTSVGPADAVVPADKDGGLLGDDVVVVVDEVVGDDDVDVDGPVAGYGAGLGALAVDVAPNGARPP